MSALTKNTNLPKILIVDDHEENLLTIKTLLAPLEVEVIEARSGHDALSMSIRHEFALALIDTQMSGMDGYETATLLRQNPQSITTPIIFLTATHTDKKHNFQGCESGAVDYLTKPLDGDSLVAKINTFVELYLKTKQIEAISQELSDEIACRKLAETEQAKLQAKVRKMQTMESLVALVDGICHEFNNLFGFSIEHLTLARKNIAENDPCQAHLQKVDNGLNRAVSLIKQMQFFGCENERSFETVELEAVIRQAVEKIQQVVPRNIRLHTSIDAPGRMIIADKPQIEHVINNLCENAIQALETTGGILRIHLDEVELNEKFIRNHPHIEAGTYLRLSVSDTGSGMSNETKAKIFDPFFTTREVGEGSGLGLCMVYGIVKEHDGCVAMHSTPDQGSVFYVYLPMVQNEVAHEASKEIKTSLNENSVCVLLIEEDEEMGYFGKCMLEQLGHTVTLKTTGKSALTEFREKAHHYDTVILSETIFDTPDLNFARKLNSLQPNTPIVLATPDSEAFSQEICSKAGIHVRIKKPYLLKDFQNAIKDATAQLTNQTH